MSNYSARQSVLQCSNYFDNSVPFSSCDANFKKKMAWGVRPVHQPFRNWRPRTLMNEQSSKIKYITKTKTFYWKFLFTARAIHILIPNHSMETTENPCSAVSSRRPNLHNPFIFDWIHFKIPFLFCCWRANFNDIILMI